MGLDRQDPHEGREGREGREGQAPRPPRCPVARPGLASRGGGAQLRLVVINLASYPVRLLLLDHAGEEQPHKTLLVDQAHPPATAHRPAPTLHTTCHHLRTISHSPGSSRPFRQRRWARLTAA